MAGRSKLELDAERRAEALRTTLLTDVRRLIEDAGLAQAEVARRARISTSMLSRMLAGERVGQLESLLRISMALGADMQLRLTPGVGVALRDRFSARMAEALICAGDDVWRMHPEVTIVTPARGSIDLVLESRRGDPLLVAAEFHSELRRLEPTLRWSAEKAAGLRHTPLARQAAAVTGLEPAIGRLLVLRNTEANRHVATEFARTLAAAYPVGPREAVLAIAEARPWPGDAIIWMSVHGREARLLPGPPRGG